MGGSFPNKKTLPDLSSVFLFDETQHYAPDLLNRGLMVYQAIAGKKTMGTANPGNNSGN